jgi:ABC-type metal ion transport system substrate-binding protein
MDAFQTLVIGLGYHDSAWKNWIVDRAAEYHEQDTEDLKATLNQWSEDEVSNIVFHSDVKLTDKEIDEAFAQHNAHEEGFDLDEDEYDDYGQLIEPNEALKKAAKKYKKNKKK